MFNIFFFLLAAAFAEESRQKIFIIDTGIENVASIEHLLCENGLRDFTFKGIRDNVGHGTNIANIIAKKIDNTKFCLVISKWFDSLDEDKTAQMIHLVQAVMDAATEPNVKLVNLSIDGSGFSEEEHQAFTSLLNRKTTIVVAAGNNSRNLSLDCSIYPACYRFPSDFYKVIGSCDGSGNRHSFSNYGGPITECENGKNVNAGGHTLSGTSQAAAVHSNKLVLQWQKEMTDEKTNNTSSATWK